MIKKLPSVALIFSLFILLYTFYRSEIFNNGEMRSYYSIYYIISFFLILSSISLYFLSEKMRKNIFFFSLSIIVPLYVIEIYLTSINIERILDERTYNIPFKAKIYKEKTGKEYDRNSVIENYIKRSKDLNATLKISPYYHVSENYELFPISGISNILTFYDNENGYHSEYISDRYGFNNPDEEWENKFQEYVLIGDSLVHGCCVNRPDDMASVLRNLSGKSVINLGYSSNGPLVELASLREFLPNNTKKILWFFYEGNDLSDLNYELSNNTLTKYSEDIQFSQNLINETDKVDKILDNILSSKINEYVDFANESKTFKFKLIGAVKFRGIREFIRITFFQKKPKSFDFIPDDYIYSQFKKVLQLAQYEASLNNSKFYVIYLPQYSRYLDGFDNNNYHRIKSIVEDLDINFIDIDKEVFQKEDNPFDLYPFGLNAHFNEIGYRKISEQIYQMTKND